MKKDFLIAAFILEILLLPLCASSEATIPYIEIIAPEDGSNVGETTTLEFVAEGYDLKNPYVTIRGEHMGFSFPLKDCENTVIEESTGSMPSSQTNRLPMRMHCKTTINLANFVGQDITLTVGISDGSQRLTDSVGLSVSGECARLL